jgi:hypothetical protein
VTRSCPHLRLGQLVEGDRRAVADCRLMRHWWRRWEAREREEGDLGGAGCGEERHPLFIGGERRYPGLRNAHAELVLACGNGGSAGRSKGAASDET